MLSLQLQLQLHYGGNLSGTTVERGVKILIDSFNSATIEFQPGESAFDAV